MFLVNSRLKSLAAAPQRGRTLSRSYGRCFAEFLNEGSLVRLGLLDLFTCVGLRYDLYIPSLIQLFLAARALELNPPEGFFSSCSDHVPVASLRYMAGPLIDKWPAVYPERSEWYTALAQTFHSKRTFKQLKLRHYTKNIYKGRNINRQVHRLRLSASA